MFKQLTVLQGFIWISDNINDPTITFFSLFSVPLVSRKRTWENSFRSRKREATAQCLLHVPVYQLLFLPSTFWSTHLPRLSGLKSDLPDSLWFVGRTQQKVPALPIGVVLRSTASWSVMPILTLGHPEPVLRTRACPSVRGIIFSWVVISKPLREKWFWKHLPDSEYSKTETWSCYLFKGTKSTAGVGALQIAVIHLPLFR